MAMIPQRWSNGHLALLFALSLLLFSVLRWHPDVWLHDKIDGMARQAGIGLQFRSLDLDGMTLRMDGVSLDLPGMAMPILLDRLSVSPHWLALLTGKPGGNVSLLWHGQPFRFSVAIQGRQARLHIADSDIAVPSLQFLWQKRLALPVSLAGDLHLHGDVTVSLADGRPVKGKIALEWKGARVSMPGMSVVLGSYRLQGGGKQGVWRFHVQGGDGARLKASGQLNASSPDSRTWMVQAQGQLSAKPGSSLVGMMGGKPLQFDLSGPAASPQWHLSSQQVNVNSGFLRL